MEHLDENVLVDFARGALARAGRDAVEDHVDRCATCRQLVVTLARGPSLRDAATVDGDADPDSPLQPGARLGRFAVEGELGHGASGVVYAAYDPELDRKIAIKVLHRDAGAAHERVLREARALAKLADPCVVGVFDAGTLDDRVFIAMELVDGDTLRAWLAAAPRSWRAIRGVMLAAGRGLAAAHAAGLVHRDVKPDNILVGHEGRVRIGDFGLAAIDHATARGLVGTPAYMAHEQLVGGRADARSDQFSFAVVLYEACYGKRPFTGMTVAALAEAIERGPVLDPPPGRIVPRHVRALLARALAADPARRFPAMPDLLAELARDPDRTRVRVLALAGAGAAIAIVAAVVATRATASDDACSGGTAQLAEAWNPGRRAEVTRAFAATRRPHLATTTAGTLAGLDAYGAAWRAQHAGTCHAHRRGEISATLLDRRMTCLERGRTALRALVDVLRTADGEVVDGAFDAIRRLPHLESCAGDPNVARIEPAIAGQLAEVRALRDAGKYAAARARLDAALAAALATAHDATIADARLLEGELAHLLARTAAARDPLREAVKRAGDARDDATLARALVALLAVEVAEARHADAEATALLAGVLAKRHGLEVELALALGDLRTSQGRYRDAREQYARALAADTTPVAAVTSRAHLGHALAEHGFLAEARAELQRAHASAIEHLGASHPTTARTAILLGGVLARLGDNDADADALLDGGLATLEQNLGEHTLVAAALETIGIALADRGDATGARARFERALAIREAIARPDHPAIAATIDLIAGVLVDVGDLAGARAQHTRALELRRAALGAGHAEVASSIANLARVAYYEGKYAEARQQLDDALALAKRSGDELMTSTILANRAAALVELGEYAAARDDLRAALAVVEARLGPDHPDAATIRSTLAAVLDDPAARRAELDRALAIRVAALGDAHADAGRSHHELAAFLIDARDLPAATSHAERAVAILTATLGPDHVETALARLPLATAHQLAGALADAATEAERALAAVERALGPEHPVVAGALAIAGSIDRRRGATATARKRLERARAIYRALGTAPDRLADVERELALLPRKK